MLPDFVIGGAPKCATTALAQYLDQHPEIFISNPKEPHYFASAALGRAVMKGAYSRAEYEALFERKRPGQRTGEGSTHYLHHGAAVAPLMASMAPHTRLVFCLRNPVDRAYSHFLFRYGVAGMHTPGGMGSGFGFEDFVQDEEVFSMGDYARNLAFFYDHFPAEQILVILFDDIRDDLCGVLSRICQHIGVDDLFTFDVSECANKTAYPRWPFLMPFVDKAACTASSVLDHHKRQTLIRLRRRLLFDEAARKPRLSSTEREKVAALYRSGTSRLQQMIGRDLTQWNLG